MRKQCVIVGLGKYGSSVAKKLSNSNIEVLAIDSNSREVEKISKYVTKAVCMDVTSEDAWERLPLKDFDIGIVCFGENITASILTCMALQEAKVKYIIAKAGDKLHMQVLKKIGVSEVVLPEEYVAQITAEEILAMQDDEE